MDIIIGKLYKPNGNVYDIDIEEKFEQNERYFSVKKKHYGLCEFLKSHTIAENILQDIANDLKCCLRLKYEIHPQRIEFELSRKRMENLISEKLIVWCESAKVYEHVKRIKERDVEIECTVFQTKNLPIAKERLNYFIESSCVSLIYQFFSLIDIPHLYSLNNELVRLDSYEIIKKDTNPSFQGCHRVTYEIKITGISGASFAVLKTLKEMIYGKYVAAIEKDEKNLSSNKFTDLGSKILLQELEEEDINIVFTVKPTAVYVLKTVVLQSIVNNLKTSKCKIDITGNNVTLTGKAGSVRFIRNIIFDKISNAHSIHLDLFEHHESVYKVLEAAIQASDYSKNVSIDFNKSCLISLSKETLRDCYDFLKNSIEIEQYDYNHNLIDQIEKFNSQNHGQNQVAVTSKKKQTKEMWIEIKRLFEKAVANSIKVISITEISKSASVFHFNTKISSADIETLDSINSSLNVEFYRRKLDNSSDTYDKKRMIFLSLVENSRHLLADTQYLDYIRKSSDCDIKYFNEETKDELLLIGQIDTVIGERDEISRKINLYQKSDLSFKCNDEDYKKFIRKILASEEKDWTEFVTVLPGNRLIGWDKSNNIKQQNSAEEAKSYFEACTKIEEIPDNEGLLSHLQTKEGEEHVNSIEKTWNSSINFEVDDESSNLNIIFVENEITSMNDKTIQCDALVNNIAVMTDDLSQGGSISKAFLKKFPRIATLEMKSYRNIKITELEQFKIIHTRVQHHNDITKEKDLISSLQNVLSYAIENKLTSIALPPIGCGYSQYDPRIVAHYMYHSITDLKYKYTDISLKKVFIVCLSGAGHVLTEPFKAIEERSIKVCIYAEKDENIERTTKAIQSYIKEQAIVKKINLEKNIRLNSVENLENKYVKIKQLRMIKTNEQFMEIVGIKQFVDRSFDLTKELLENAKEKPITWKDFDEETDPEERLEFMKDTWRDNENAVASSDDIEILGIERSENPRLYQAYSTEHKKFCESLSSDKFPMLSTKTSKHCPVELSSLLAPEINEFYFFHGTNSASKDKILHQGFDFRLGEVGYYGKGAYFAEDPKKSDGYTFGRGKTIQEKYDIKRHIIIGRVILGNSTVVSRDSNLKRPPCKTCKANVCKDHNEYFDSVRGNGGLENIFWEYIVYSLTQCYPEYLVTYKLKQKENSSGTKIERKNSLP
ncbi:DgyrCDS11740 [Dimorphilus gyrociliatus]|uniref:Poly [ADP-ribose] polymerase n=1 Tax=Dimorphilus gyrociliatus TaxID=2664684 RepID=A0A7I8W4B1_9ANNE|nr:DgyrCDS11740 [Dimorphilus gyrociliatus]